MTRYMASNRNGIENIVKKYNLCNNESKEVTLERSEREKDIGVMMDQNVNFSKHIRQQDYKLKLED
jgi:hypothetical protein